jgi:hypothetical protein
MSKPVFGHSLRRTGTQASKDTAQHRFRPMHRDGGVDIHTLEASGYHLHSHLVPHSLVAEEEDRGRDDRCIGWAHSTISLASPSSHMGWQCDHHSFLGELVVSSIPATPSSGSEVWDQGGDQGIPWGLWTLQVRIGCGALNALGHLRRQNAGSFIRPSVRPFVHSFIHPLRY